MHCYECWESEFRVEMCEMSLQDGRNTYTMLFLKSGLILMGRWGHRKKKNVSEPEVPEDSAGSGAAFLYTDHRYSMNI